jgi:MoxR-like ATPase
MCAVGVSELPDTSHTGVLDAVVEQIGQVLLGKEQPIRLALACLLASGHLLIEDIPGVGKTTLAHALARSLGLSFNRIQFTSDLLPADILGVSVYHRELSQFEFHPGPVFSQVVLADEVNRATPKAQSALLEAMEEQQVTHEGETRPLPNPFFVIATQNPSTQIGTFALPESQLDRFLMRLELGYPSQAAERALLKGRDRKTLLSTLEPCIHPEELASLQETVTTIHVSDALLDYLQALIAHSRDATQFQAGLSPRAGIALLRCTQAWALMSGRSFALPEDLQTVLPGVVGHRLIPFNATAGISTSTVIDSLLARVPIP